MKNDRGWHQSQKVCSGEGLGAAGGRAPRWWGKGSVRTGQSCSWEHKKKVCSSCTVWNNFKPSKCSCLSQTEIIHFAQIGFYKKTFPTSVYHLSDTLAEKDQNTHFKVKVRTFLYSHNVLSGPCNVTEAVILVQTWCESWDGDGMGLGSGVDLWKSSQR